MDLELTGKTVIVTGGGSNIGREISLNFGKEGANVVVAEIDEKQGQKIADEITQAGPGKAICVKTDVTDFASVQAMAQAAIDEFGQVHVLVNNVGWDNFVPFVKTNPDMWERIINLNYRQQIHGMKAVMDHMIEKKYGRIVNIGSDAGRVGEFRESIYSGCKAGVIGLSKSVAKEVGKFGITVNVVCPGATPPGEGEVGEESMFSGKDADHNVGALMTPEVAAHLAKTAYPLRRLGKAQDVTNAVLFLASDKADYITGQTLSVNGGYSMM